MEKHICFPGAVACIPPAGEGHTPEAELWVKLSLSLTHVTTFGLQLTIFIVDESLDYLVSC